MNFFKIPIFHKKTITLFSSMLFLGLTFSAPMGYGETVPSVPSSANAGLILNHQINTIQAIRSQPWLTQPIWAKDLNPEKDKPVIEFIDRGVQGTIQRPTEDLKPEPFSF